MATPARRTLIVLILLVSAMTLASGALLGLEPGPKAPGGPTSLVALGNSGDSLAAMLDVAIPPHSERWTAIAIHFSGTAYGSAQSLHEVHNKMGLGGLGYHLVIGNGLGSADGQIEAGFRWSKQLQGISAGPAASSSANHSAIDICLIGDGNRRPPTEAQMRELVWLVQNLQARFDIAPEQVRLYTDANSGRGRLFPVAWFRQQLLHRSAP